MSDDCFEATLERLEAEREQAEGEYVALLGQLRGLLAVLPQAATVADHAAREAEGDRPDVTVHAPIRSPEVADEVRLGEVPWPRAAGGRGLVNRIAYWVLRDYLEALDRRHDATMSALQAQAATARGTMATASHLAERHHQLSVQLAGVADAVGRLHTLIEATRALVARVVEVVELTERGAEQLRRLADYKNAETLQRAVSGPLRRMDVLFDEVARQQEALLAELVGKRAELEALIASLRAPAGD